MTMAYDRKFYPVKMLTDKSQPEVGGDILIRLIWKGNKETGRVAHSARFVSVPAWQPELHGKDNSFVPMLIEAFEEHRRKIAHRYVSELLAGKQQEGLEIPAEVLSPQNVLEDWEAEQEESDSSRGKLTKEGIAAWFDKNMRDTLVLTLCEKNGFIGENATDETVAKMEKAAHGYKKVLELLAAPKSVVNIDQAGLLQKALQLVPEELQKVDGTHRKLLAKVGKILNPPEKAEQLLEML